MSSALPAALLPRSQPRQRGLLEGQGILRRVEARSRESLIEAMGVALSTLSTAMPEASLRTAATNCGPTIMTNAFGETADSLLQRLIRVNAFDRRCTCSGRDSHGALRDFM
jgi:hypothetical protein